MATRLTPTAVLMAFIGTVCSSTGGGLLAEEKDQVVKVRILAPRILDGKGDEKV